MPLQSVSLIIKSMLKDCLGPMENTIVSREFSKAYGLLTPNLLTAVHGPGSQLYSVRTESRRKGQQGSCWCHTLVVKPKNDEDSSLAPLPCSAQKSTPPDFCGAGALCCNWHDKYFTMLGSGLHAPQFSASQEPTNWSVHVLS